MEKRTARCLSFIQNIRTANGSHFWGGLLTIFSDVSVKAHTEHYSFHRWYVAQVASDRECGRIRCYNVPDRLSIRSVNLLGIIWNSNNNTEIETNEKKNRASNVWRGWQQRMKERSEEKKQQPETRKKNLYRSKIKMHLALRHLKNGYVFLYIHIILYIYPYTSDEIMVEVECVLCMFYKNVEWVRHRAQAHDASTGIQIHFFFHWFSFSIVSIWFSTLSEFNFFFFCLREIYKCLFPTLALRLWLYSEWALAGVECARFDADSHAKD